MVKNMSEEGMGGFVSFIDLLQQHAKGQPEAIAYRFLRDGERETGSLTYRALLDTTLNLATKLQKDGFTGERALLIFHSGLDYVVALLACFCAGVIAVPAYPPRNGRNLPRIEGMVVDAEAMVVLTSSSLRQSLRCDPDSALGRAHWIATDLLPMLPDEWKKPHLSCDSIAYLQYTSGSTGTPKGVIVTHGNLIHNSARICERFKQDRQSRFVSWLPLFHDLGLIFGVLTPLYAGGSCTLMSPAAFLQRPYRWLKAISDYRATTSGGPNFAYDLCARRISEQARSDLDLSSWRIALNGAEPVRAVTLEGFSQAFQGCGFQPKTHKPSYGLAEATLVVSCTAEESDATLLTISPELLETRSEAVPLLVEKERARTVVSSGRPFSDQTVLIVDPQNGRALSDGLVGEIWVSGPSVAHGYWRHPEETEAIFGALCPDLPEMRFLRTGDLGFYHQGDLFIAGRLKDVIILRGRNIYPQDIEAVVETSHSALRVAGAAAFSLDVGGEEELVVVAELDHQSEGDSTEIVEAVRGAVSEAFDATVYAVELIAPGSLPKTSSGKVQRRLTCAQFQGRILPSIHRWENVSLSAPLVSHETEIEGILKQELSRLLRIESSQFDLQKPFTVMGLDSLAAATFTGIIETRLGIRYPIGALFGGMTLEKLVSTLSAEYEECAAERKVQRGGKVYETSPSASGE
jgi:acyl-CoA synthetase (AMP-forming)/AMP-acid ligase II